MKNAFAAQVPVDDLGNQLRWKKSTQVQIFVPHGAGKGITFVTRVVGYTTIKSVHCMLLQHTSEVSQAAQRKYRRKEIDRPCYFYMVQIMTVGTGRDASKQAVPQTKGALGTMQWVFDIHDDGIFWCTAAIGWVTRHNYVAHGPPARGATLLL